MEFIALLPIIVGIAGIIIGVVVMVHEERQKDRKILELEIELAIAKEKLAAKQ